MFDIGFSEIVVIMVVALIVIGPERLPKVARTLGLLWGRAQRYVNGVRADIERDMNLEEIRQIKLKMEQDVLAAEMAARETVETLDHNIQSIAAPTEPKPIELSESKPVELSEPKPVSESQLKSVPAPTTSPKPKETATPVQQQFPID
jgi:sec-independent protein translocase protein TatB